MAKVYLQVSGANMPQQEKPTSGGKPTKKVTLKVKKPDLSGEFYKYEKDIDDNLSTYDKEIKNYYNGYLNSPLYRQRLLGMGYKNPDDAIKLRQANVNITKTEKKFINNSEYKAADQKVDITAYDKLNNPDANLKSIMAHEYSHVAGSLHFLTPKFPDPMKMSYKEFDEMYKRNKLRNIDTSKLTPQQKADHDHDIYPTESKADIDSLRYRLYSDGMYDAGKQEFNKGHLEKAKQKYKDDYQTKRLFKNFSDEDIIWLMNNIAKNKNNNSNIA